MHLWLKRGVQERLLAPGGKATLKETMITFGISSMWHGLYPFYYVMFFFCALIVELSKEIYRSRYLFSFLSPEMSHILGNQCTMLMLNYLGSAFTCLTFERGWNFAKATYFYPFITLFGLLFAWKTLGITKMAQKMQKADMEK